MRKVPHFLKKNPNSLWIRLVLWGREWLFFCGKILFTILRTFDFSSRTRKYFADFSATENCHFRPQETNRIWREIGIFLRKCDFFLIRRLRFSLWSGYLGDQPARIEELQSADETNATFSHENPSFSWNSTRFLGSKVAIFPYFWAPMPEPETTSLPKWASSLSYHGNWWQLFCRGGRFR